VVIISIKFGAAKVYKKNRK